MNSILLSAGFGKRFLPHTNFIAKPAIPFLNLPLICYSLFYANKFMSSKIIINTHHLPETIEACVNKYKSYLKPKIQFLNEFPQILDSGGGIKNAQNYLKEYENFFVFNTDIPHMFPNFDITHAVSEHIKNKALATIITCNLENLGEKVSGVWTKTDSLQVQDFGLGPKQGLKCRHYTGLMILSKSLFNYQPKDKPHNILYDVILPTIQNKNEVAFCHHIDNLRWFETGNLDSFLSSSFKTIDDLIDTPDSITSSELKNISSFFQQNLFVYSDNKRRIISANKSILENPLNFRGHIVSFSNPQVAEGQIITNSVINSDGVNLPTGSFSNQLIL